MVLYTGLVVYATDLTPTFTKTSASKPSDKGVYRLFSATIITTCGPTGAIRGGACIESSTIH